jgi:hypothetical protein
VKRTLLEKARKAMVMMMMVLVRVTMIIYGGG